MTKTAYCEVYVWHKSAFIVFVLASGDAIIMLMDPNLNNGEENPYDFIFRPDPNAPVIAQKSGNKSKQIIIFVIFLFVILTIVAVVLSVLSSSSKPKATEAISAQAYQTELLRVIDFSEKNIVSSNLQQKALTLNLVLLDDQKKLSETVTAKGVIPTAFQLGQYQDAKRDDQLTQSLQTDRHDQVFEEMVDGLFTKYYQALKAAEQSATTKKEKDAITALRKHAEILYNTGATDETTTDQPQSQNQGGFQSSDTIQN